MPRPAWDNYFMEITLAVSERSTCTRAHVGAILVKDKRILTTGYNGAPKGLPHCLDEGCEIVDGHCVRALHAEQNAILQGAQYGVPLEGATCYTTHQPCVTCAKMLINAGIKRVVYAGRYPDELAMRYMREAGLSVERMDLGERTPAPPPSIIAEHAHDVGEEHAHDVGEEHAHDVGEEHAHDVGEEHAHDVGEEHAHDAVEEPS